MPSFVPIIFVLSPSHEQEREQERAARTICRFAHSTYHRRDPRRSERRKSPLPCSLSSSASSRHASTPTPNFHLTYSCLGEPCYSRLFPSMLLPHRIHGIFSPRPFASVGQRIYTSIITTHISRERRPSKPTHIHPHLPTPHAIQVRCTKTSTNMFRCLRFVVGCRRCRHPFTFPFLLRVQQRDCTKYHCRPEIPGSSSWLLLSEPTRDTSWLLRDDAHGQRFNKNSDKSTSTSPTMTGSAGLPRGYPQ